VTVYVRGERREREMRALAARLGRPVRVASFDAAGQALHSDLVVATTPAGATDALCPLVPPRGPAGAPGMLFDVVYDPWPTPLAAAWRAAGGTVVGGLDLLVHQAGVQVELMTRRSPAPVAAMRTAGEKALEARGLAADTT
ncbi:MAG: shikimate dehydrogenase, partial [Micromonosporaceae bacterium]